MLTSVFLINGSCFRGQQNMGWGNSSIYLNRRFLFFFFNLFFFHFFSLTKDEVGKFELLTS